MVQSIKSDLSRWTRQTAFQGVRLIKMGNYTLSWQCKMAGGWLGGEAWHMGELISVVTQGGGSWRTNRLVPFKLHTAHSTEKTWYVVHWGAKKMRKSALLPEWICAQHPCPLTKWKRSHPSAIQDKSHCRYIVNNTWKKCSAHTSHFAHRNGTK